MTKRSCPRCERLYHGWPALSRRDNVTDICPPCGQEEAMIDAGFLRPGRTTQADEALARDRRFRDRVAREEDER